MIQTEKILRENKKITDYKINIHKKDSYELFFVKGKLETVRCTDTCDKEVTVYAEHDGFLGDSKFNIYPSTTEEELAALAEETADKALLIPNKAYTLPSAEEGSFTVDSNFNRFRPEELAAVVSKTVFSANTVENGSLNAVEVFINRHTDTVINSRGMHKTQVRYDAMVEAIPTYNGEQQSVELYEQYNFNNVDTDTLYQEIAGMMLAVKARYEAVKPTEKLEGKVIFNKTELSRLMDEIAGNLRYMTIYSHAGMYAKGDAIQKDIQGDPITITMTGEAEGSPNSAKFDSDGLTLGAITIVDKGVAVNYYGDNRYGQYLEETPTGDLRCMVVSTGSVTDAQLQEGPYLEIISMSGLQTDFFSNYIGGEVRLAYWHDGKTITPVTGISISGQLDQVLNTIRLSESKASWNAYVGPAKAIVSGMNIY